MGAACGRIHPTGSGYIPWYQKFEYAVGHWLQKATEHVLGCVLCSPGCFSLFRGSALIDDNVMRKYATPPTEARHHIQFDQGEDRSVNTYRTGFRTPDSGLHLTSLFQMAVHSPAAERLEGGILCCK